MTDRPPASIYIGGDAEHAILIAGSHNIVVLAAEQARAQGRDPARMLRILALLAAPVYDPHNPDHPPPSLDLRDEWQRLAGAVRDTHAPILLARLTPPTLDALRRHLSPRAAVQETYPHTLHFSGHAWADGLLLEDEYGQSHPVTVAALLEDLDLPRPLDLVVLNACESAAHAHSVAQALVARGLARSVVGHPRPVFDPQAIAFARTLYADLTDGHPLADAVNRADRHLTTHRAVLVGDGNLRFSNLTRSEPVVEDARPRGRLPPRGGVGFFGRGAELVRIARALGERQSLAPVVLISGPPGIGKTTVALEAAHRNAWRYPGGVAYAEAARGNIAHDLLIALAAALGLERPEDLLPATALQPILLVLDNLETLPAEEREALARHLARLGEGSAALITLRPPEPALKRLPTARPLPLHQGLDIAAAVAYVLALARQWGIPLSHHQDKARAGAEALTKAQALADAADGHPELLRLLVAQALDRDLEALLDEVRGHRGDYEAQLDVVYAWCAGQVGKAGRRAWQALLLFPAGQAPEGPLRAAVAGEEAMAAPALDALRAAAVADFDPARQVWTWHATAAEYAARHWPLDDGARRGRLAALLPAWVRWLEALPPETPATATRLEAQQVNLDLLLTHAPHLPREDAQAWLRVLHRVLPPPDHTLALRPWEEQVYRSWARLSAGEAERAQAFGMLGYALSALGRREEALQATQEAVDIRRRLAQQQPDAFLPDLARSLNNLGNQLSDLGQREEALAATQEAVEIRRGLAQAQPQAFLPDLAGSLNNLGNRLSELGRREEALAATQEAADLYRGLAQAQPQAFLPDLAMSLNNLGNRLSDLGRREEALAATQEAVEIRRGLAQAQPQAFLPDLARSLNNLGDRLKEIGQPEQALAAYEEAVRILAPFYLQLPPAFENRMSYMLRDYVEACQAAGREPDRALPGLVEKM